MTVCVAAISQNGIFGASDRMLTAADVEFEPERPKLYNITNSIVVMTSGDAGVHTEILTSVIGTVAERIESEPNRWVRVKAVAELYVSTWNEIKRQRSEARLLAPLGLTHETFISNQGIMRESLASRLQQALIEFQIPDISAIVAGVDQDGGAHIFVVRNDDITCQDSIGFTAIGIGARHALSQFMQAGHTPAKLPIDTLLLTYIAKKRAETAPGVGKDTDVFVVSGLGAYGKLTSVPLLRTLEDAYNKIVQDERLALSNAAKELLKYFDAPDKDSQQSQEVGGGADDASSGKSMEPISHQVHEIIEE